MSSLLTSFEVVEIFDSCQFMSGFVVALFKLEIYDGKTCSSKKLLNGSLLKDR